MKTIDRKLLRDIWRLRTQLSAIALVMAAGIGVFVMSWSMLASLKQTQESFYEQYRFAHVFAQLKRAPDALAARIAALPDVVQAETRVAAGARLDMPGLAEPASAKCVSVPDRPDVGLNLLHLRSGRYLDPRRPYEAIVSEAFAVAHGLRPGDKLTAIINGRRYSLTMVGTAVSAEYVYQIREGDVFPNDRTFAVLWMSRSELAAAFDMEGAFNDVALYLAPQASTADVIRRLDQLVDPYGGLGAYDRADQVSNRYVTNELRELRNMGWFAPVIFLSVSAFLLNIVLSRIVGMQRTQIAALRAFGFTRREIGRHYLKLTLSTALLGSVIGLAAGFYLGRSMTSMYVRFFHFPVLEFRMPPEVIAAAALISAASAVLGTYRAVRRAAGQPPAAAMRPESPAEFRESLLERIVGARLSPPTRMIFRNLERKSSTTVLSVLGLATAVAVLVLGSFVADSLDYLIDFQFFTAQRHDVQITFNEPVAAATVYNLAQLPGVVRVEPFRGVAVRLRHRHLSRRQGILGLDADAQLVRPVYRTARAAHLPTDGLVFSDKLAALLDVRPGDFVEVDVLEGRRPTRRVQVVGLIDDLIGTSAYMRSDAAMRLADERQTVSGAFLTVDAHRRDELFRKLKETPQVAGVSDKLDALRGFRGTLESTLLRMRAANIFFAALIAVGVVYNSARIAVEEQARDLATMRVLGFTRGEVSYVLLGQLAVLTALALPPGLLLGRLLAEATTAGYDTELFRIPVVVSRSTYGLAAVTTVVAAALSGLVVRRRLDRLDLLDVLKAGE